MVQIHSKQSSNRQSLGCHDCLAYTILSCSHGICETNPHWLTGILHGYGADRQMQTRSSSTGRTPTGWKSLLLTSSKMSMFKNFILHACSVAPILYRLSVYRLYQPKILVSAISNITKCILV